MEDGNPINEEIRQTREKMLARHNGDINALFHEVKRLSEDRAKAKLAAQPGGNNHLMSKKVG